jgi:hypothetical protein
MKRSTQSSEKRLGAQVSGTARSRLAALPRGWAIALPFGDQATGSGRRSHRIHRRAVGVSASAASSEIGGQILSRSNIRLGGLTSGFQLRSWRSAWDHRG